MKNKHIYCVLILFGIAVLFCVQIYVKQSLIKPSLSIYDSKYTEMKENGKGNYDFYIYSSAVQWKDGNTYKKIDNSIVESENRKYIYENLSNSIKTYFPQFCENTFLIESDKGSIYFEMSCNKKTKDVEKKNFINIYGDEREAVKYEVSNYVDVYMYPINSGIHVEYIFNEGICDTDIIPELVINVDEFDVNDSINEYLELSQNQYFKIIINGPLQLDKKEILYDKYWKTNKVDNLLYIKPSNINLTGKEKTRISFCIQINGEDVPDTSLYENSDENVYLSDRAVVGKATKKGRGIHYTRFRINYFIYTNDSSVEKAEYFMKNLNNASGAYDIKLYAPQEQWSSTEMIWNSKVNYGGELQNGKIVFEDDGWIKIDMTSFVKKAVDDLSGSTESIGSVIDSYSDYMILATSDNGEYIPYLKITLNKLPMNFYSHESINEMY